MQLIERMTAFLQRRAKSDALRLPKHHDNLIDFCSNDYLSLSLNPVSLADYNGLHGSTGSRLLSGHYPAIEELEQLLAKFHKAPSALLFNSGYAANLSLLSALPRKKDVIFYDELIHASIHDGIRLSQATAIAFRHNDCEHLEALLSKYPDQDTFVLTESIYSMDGDAAPLVEIAHICEQNNAFLIVDEAHSTGIYGPNGAGLVVELNLEDKVFARVHTFGKAIGAHGATVVGSELLKTYLFNTARPLIYTTSLPPVAVSALLERYNQLQTNGQQLIKSLNRKINYFLELAQQHNLPLLKSKSPIQSLIVPGNQQVVDMAKQLQSAGFDVRPIRKPTVPAGSERIRICLHLHNSDEDIRKLVTTAHTLQLNQKQSI